MQTPSDINDQQVGASNGNMQPSDNQVDPVVTRIQQENAVLSKALSALGIDPSSSAVQAIANGNVTREQIGVQPPVSNEPSLPVNQEQKALASQLKEKIHSLTSGDITRESFATIMNDVVETISAIESKDTEKELTNNYINCMDAVQRAVPQLENAPKEVQQALADSIWAATNDLALREGNKVGRPDAYLNPEAYSYFAKKVAANMENVLSFAKGLGKNEYSSGLRNIPANKFNIAGTGDGSGSMNISKPVPTRDGVRNAVKNYVAQYVNSNQGI